MDDIHIHTVGTHKIVLAAESIERFMAPKVFYLLSVYIVQAAQTKSVSGI